MSDVSAFCLCTVLAIGFTSVAISLGNIASALSEVARSLKKEP